MNDRSKRVGQPGRGKRDLPVLRVDVELATLRPRAGRELGLVDRCRTALKVKDAGEDETAQPSPNNRDGGRISCRLQVWASKANCLDSCSRSAIAKVPEATCHSDFYF